MGGGGSTVQSPRSSPVHAGFESNQLPKELTKTQVRVLAGKHWDEDRFSELFKDQNTITKKQWLQIVENFSSGADIADKEDQARAELERWSAKNRFYYSEYAEDLVAQAMHPTAVAYRDAVYRQRKDRHRHLERLGDKAASARGLLVTDDCLAGARVKATLCPIAPVDKANVPLSTCYSVTFVQPPEDLKITRLRVCGATDSSYTMVLCPPSRWDITNCGHYDRAHTPVLVGDELLAVGGLDVTSSYFGLEEIRQLIFGAKRFPLTITLQRRAPDWHLLFQHLCEDVRNTHAPTIATKQMRHFADVFSAAARQTVALVLLRHSKDLFLPFTEDENERQQPTDSRLPPPHVLVPASEYLYRNMHLRLVAGGGVQANRNLWEVQDKMALNRLTSCAAVLKVLCCPGGTLGDTLRVPMAAVVRHLGRTFEVRSVAPNFMSLELMPDPSSNVAAAGAVRMRLAPQRDSDAADERVDGKDGSANAGEFHKPSDSRGVATKGDEAEDKLLKQLGLVSARHPCAQTGHWRAGRLGKYSVTASGSAPPVLDGDALAYVQGLQDMLPPAAARLKARAWRLPANDMRFEEEIDVVHVVQRALGFDLSQEDAMSESSIDSKRSDESGASGSSGSSGVGVLSFQQRLTRRRNRLRRAVAPDHPNTATKAMLADRLALAKLMEKEALRYDGSEALSQRMAAKAEATEADRLLTMEAVPVCSGRGVLVAHTWQPRKENFLLSDAKRVAKAETPTALSLARSNTHKSRGRLLSSSLDQITAGNSSGSSSSDDDSELDMPRLDLSVQRAELLAGRQEDLMCPTDDSLSVSSDLSLSEYGSLKELERWRLQEGLQSGRDVLLRRNYRAEAIMQELAVTQQHPGDDGVSPTRLIYGDAVVLLHYGLGSGRIAPPSSESHALAVREAVVPALRQVLAVDAARDDEESPPSKPQWLAPAFAAAPLFESLRPEGWATTDLTSQSNSLLPLPSPSFRLTHQLLTQGVAAGLQRLRSFAQREFVFGAVHVSVLGRMHHADQINGVYDAIMVGDDTHHCGRPCYKLRGVEAYLYFCRDNFEFLEQSRAGAKGQWRIGPSIGSNAFWASYHGEGNESLTPDRLPLIGSTADLTSLKSSAADDDDGFESEPESKIEFSSSENDSETDDSYGGSSESDISDISDDEAGHNAVTASPKSNTKAKPSLAEASRLHARTFRGKGGGEGWWCWNTEGFILDPHMHTLPGSYIPSPGGGKAQESEPQPPTSSASAVVRGGGKDDDGGGESVVAFPEMDVEEPEGPSAEVFTEHTIETVLDLDIMALLHPCGISCRYLGHLRRRLPVKSSKNKNTLRKKNRFGPRASSLATIREMYGGSASKPSPAATKALLARQTAQAESDCLRQVLLAEMVARVVRRRMAADYHRTLTRGNTEYESLGLLLCARSIASRHLKELFGVTRMPGPGDAEIVASTRKGPLMDPFWQVKIKIWLDATFEGALTHAERMHIYDLRMSLRPLGWLLLWQRVFTLCGVGLVAGSARDVARMALEGRGSGIVESYKTVRLHPTAKTLFRTAHPTLRTTISPYSHSYLNINANPKPEFDPSDGARMPPSCFPSAATQAAEPLLRRLKGVIEIFGSPEAAQRASDWTHGVTSETVTTNSGLVMPPVSLLPGPLRCREWRQPSTGSPYGGEGWVLASRLLLAIAEQQQQFGQLIQARELFEEAVAVAEDGEHQQRWIALPPDTQRVTARRLSLFPGFNLGSTCRDPRGTRALLRLARFYRSSVKLPRVGCSQKLFRVVQRIRNNRLKLPRMNDGQRMPVQWQRLNVETGKGQDQVYVMELDCLPPLQKAFLAWANDAPRHAMTWLRMHHRVAQATLGATHHVTVDAGMHVAALMEWREHAADDDSSEGENVSFKGSTTACDVYHYIAKQLSSSLSNAYLPSRLCREIQAQGDVEGVPQFVFGTGDLSADNKADASQVALLLQYAGRCHLHSFETKIASGDVKMYLPIPVEQLPPSPVPTPTNKDKKRGKRKKKAKVTPSKAEAEQADPELPKDSPVDDWRQMSSDEDEHTDDIDEDAKRTEEEKEEPTPEELQQQIFREKAKQKAKEDREMHEAQKRLQREKLEAERARVVTEWQAAQRSAWVAPVLELAERSISCLAPQHRWPQPEDDDEFESQHTASTTSSSKTSAKSNNSKNEDIVSLDLAEAWSLRARGVLALLRCEGGGGGRAARKRRDRHLRAALTSLAHTLRIQTHILLNDGHHTDGGVDGDANNKPSALSHPLVAETQVLMASVQELSGQQEKALELFKSAFQAFVLTLGKLHPRTIQTAEWIGDVLYRRALNSHKIGQYALAEAVVKESLERRADASGENTCKWADAAHLLGLVLEKRGVYDKATEQYKSALRVRLSLFGRKHVSVAESMNAVGVMTHHHLKDLDGAWKLLKEALETQGALLDTGHSDTAKTSKNIIALYRGGLHTHNRRTLGENHPETIATTRFVETVAKPAVDAHRAARGAGSFLLTSKLLNKARAAKRRTKK